jgi:hypothetical protein
MREAQQPAPAPQAPAQQPLPTFSYTQDQVKDIKEFEESFPEVARAVQARMDHLAFNLASQMLTTVAQRYEPVLAQVQALAESNQISELRTRNPDYDTINKDAVLDWIEQQPAYLKAAYTHVVQVGTAAEVTDLLGRYKQSLPTAQAASAAPAAAPRPACPAPGSVSGGSGRGARHGSGPHGPHRAAAARRRRGRLRWGVQGVCEGRSEHVRFARPRSCADVCQGRFGRHSSSRDRHS